MHIYCFISKNIYFKIDPLSSIKYDRAWANQNFTS